MSPAKDPCKRKVQLLVRLPSGMRGPSQLRQPLDMFRCLWWIENSDTSLCTKAQLC
jgi:hypothetical protein